MSFLRMPDTGQWPLLRGDEFSSIGEDGISSGGNFHQDAETTYQLRDLQPHTASTLEDQNNNNPNTDPKLNQTQESQPFYAQEDPDDSSGDGDEWAPGFWRQFPYRGAIALFLCLACTMASVAVLVTADGELLSAWTLSPTVYLALLTTATNMLARVAFNEGAKIAWWRKALRGSSVADLHHYWAHADGFWSAMLAGPRFNLVTVGSIAVTFLVVDQPLIQRTVSVVSVSRTTSINATAHIAPEIPWGYTGYQPGRADTDQVMSQPMVAAFDDYNTQAAINANITGCEGQGSGSTCTGYVDAGGLAAHCTTTTGPILYQLDSVGAVVSPFSVTFDITERTGYMSSQIVMNVSYTNNSDISSHTGLRTERICYLAPATLRYPVTLASNGVLTLGDVLGAGTTQGFQPPSTGFTIDGSGDYARWTIGGLYLAASNLFASNATYTFGGAISVYLTLPDTLSNQFLDLSQAASAFSSSGPNTAAVNTSNLAYPEAFATNWTDPTAHILQALNNMAFRLSLGAASFVYRNTTAPPPPQRDLPMTYTATVNVYRAEYRFLAASTALTLVLLTLVTPGFARWWELGRRVSLDPVETAKAFDAPLLRGPGSNAELGPLVRVVGARRVRLGAVVEQEETRALGVGEAAAAARKRARHTAVVVVRRLKMADPGDVEPPRKGLRYA